MNLFGGGGKRKNRKHYPEDDAGRIGFWNARLKESEEQIRPYLKCGTRLAQLYNSMGSNQREVNLDSFDSENINRVKGSIVFAWVDQSIANMYDDDIKFTLEPKNPFSREGKDIVQAAINQHYEDASQADEDYRMCLNAHLMPFAVKKVGWSATVESQNEFFAGNISNIIIDDPEIENEALLGGSVTKVTIGQDGSRHIEKHVEALQQPGLTEEQISILEDHIQFHEEMDSFKTSPELDARVAWESPYGSCWPVDDYRQDPAATKGNEDARWVAFRVRQPLHWWIDKFGEKKCEGLKPNCGWNGKANESEGFDDYGLVEGWEVWAKDFPVAPGETANLFMVFVSDHPTVLEHSEEWPYENLNEYPAILLQFQENLKTWINKPTLTLAGADNIQQLMNEFFDSILYTIRKQKNLWLYDKDLFTPEEVDSILQAPDNTAFGVSGLSQYGKAAFIPIPFTEVGGDKTQFLNMIQNYFDRAAGTPQPIRTPGEKTAAEIGVVERRNTAREDSRRRRYNAMQRKTAKIFWKLHQEFKPETQFLIDPRLDDWAEVTPQVAKGEYQFSVRVRNRSESQAVLKKNLMDLFNLAVGTVPAFMQLGLQPPNILELFERLVKNGFEMQDVHNILPQIPSEFEKQINAIKGDPEKLATTLNAFNQLSGGGHFGPAGQAPGPANPQLMAATPSTEGGMAKQAPVA